MRAGISTTKVTVPNARLVCIANHSMSFLFYITSNQNGLFGLLVFYLQILSSLNLRKLLKKATLLYILYIYIYIYIYIYNKYNIIICSNLQLTQRFPNPLWLNTLPSLCQICPFYLHRSFSNNQVCVIRLSLEFHTLTDWLKNWIKDSQTDTMMSRLKFVPFTRILYGFNKTSHETFRKQNNRQTDILHSKHPLEKQKSM